MSDEVAETPVKRKGGRPKGSGKKRHDPPDSPVTGDLQMDVIVNREAGKRYAQLSADDIPKFRHRGYVKSERTPDGARPAWDMGKDGDDGYTVGGLTQYEVKEEQVQRFDAQAVAISNQRMKAIRQAAEATGGHITRTTELHG